MTVVAVNLAGPGNRKTKDFFTREGGMCFNCASCVYGILPSTLLLCILHTDGVSYPVMIRQIIIANLHCVIFMHCLVLNQLNTYRLNVKMLASTNLMGQEAYNIAIQICTQI